MTDINTNKIQLPSKIGVLEFREASFVPTERGHYMVINEDGNYIKCVATFTDDSQFRAFFPDFLPDTPIARGRVLAWAKLPQPRDVIKHLFHQFAEVEPLH